jgi:hypothetical protein
MVDFPFILPDSGLIRQARIGFASGSERRALPLNVQNHSARKPVALFPCGFTLETFTLPGVARFVPFASDCRQDRNSCKRSFRPALAVCSVATPCGAAIKSGANSLILGRISEYARYSVFS